LKRLSNLEERVIIDHALDVDTCGFQLNYDIRCRINHITKEDFMPAFKAAFKAITTDNVCGSFKGAGLIPLDPDAVISKLDDRLRSPI
jgi:hypothetical protein